MVTLGTYTKKYDAQVKRSVKAIIDSEYNCPEEMDKEKWVMAIFNSEFFKCYEMQQEIRSKFSYLEDDYYIIGVFKRSEEKLVKARELALI